METDESERFEQLIRQWRMRMSDLRTRPLEENEQRIATMALMVDELECVLRELPSSHPARRARLLKWRWS